MTKRAFTVLAVLFTLAAAAALALPGGPAASPSDAVHAAAPAGQAAGGTQQAQRFPRESGPPSNGPAPLTGPPSPYKPLISPNFGPNVRANTDTQSPNLAQQEPSIAVNPTNVLDIVAAAKDERAGSNTKQIWIYTSTDGGTTWINQQFPLLAPASPFSSDPIVSFSDDGQCYVTALPYGGGANDGIQVARSTDGGITFTTGVHLPGSNSNSDKEWTWVDNFPASPFYHRIYVAWMNFGSGNVVAENYSTDRGLTWSNLVNVGSASQFPMPVVLPNGNLIVSENSGSAAAYRRSTDGGATFGLLLPISSISNAPCPPDDSGCGIWRMNSIPVNSVNPVDGAMVIVWADGRTSGNARTYYSRSTDNGITWSAAAALAPPGVTNTYQVEPWVAADEQGTFHAIWYDDRANPNTSIFNIYYSQSTDDGATWSTAQVISTATSDLRIGIPSTYNGAAGDYINVAASHGNVYGVWTDTRSGTGEDVYVVHGIIVQGTPTTTATGTPPTATRTPTNTVTPTATQTPCQVNGVLQNGGFETGTLAPWTVLGTNPAPVVSNALPHSGTYSALLGTLSGGEPTGDGSIYQTITVPAGGGTLSYWWNGSTTDTINFDWQDAYVTDTSGTILATIQHTCTTTGGYVNQTFNMAPYAGQTVRIEFLVHQDGFGDDTSMYVDDVALLTACGTPTPGGSTPTRTATPVSNTATSTATPIAPTSTRTATPVGPTNTVVPPTNTIVPTSTSTPCTVSFSDVHPADYFYTPVLYLACHGVVSGYADGTFRPYNNTTRSQMVKIVVLGFGIPITTPAGGAYSFEDVPPSNPFFGYIETAAAHNIVSGYNCGTAPAGPCVPPLNRPYFLPFANVTRGQLSKIDVVAAGWPVINPVTPTFTDVLPGSAFYTFVETAVCHGVVSGYADHTFRPFNNATRGQIAKIVYLSITNPAGSCPTGATP